jgi:hypothetical protein
MVSLFSQGKISFCIVFNEYWARSFGLGAFGRIGSIADESSKVSHFISISKHLITGTSLNKEKALKHLSGTECAII